MTKAPRRILACLFALVLGASPGLADEVVLKDGSKIIGKVVGESGGFTSIRMSDGTTRRIRSGEITEIIERPEPDPPPLPPSQTRPYPLPEGVEILYNRTDRSQENPARSHADQWQFFTGPVLSEVYTQDAEPRTAVIRQRNTLVQFLGDEERAESLIARRYVAGGSGGGHIQNGTLSLGPKASMLVGVHLGRLGSQNFKTEIFRIERERRVGAPPLVTVKYRITGRGQGTVRLEGAPGVRASSLSEQSSAPASAVKIPFLGLDEEFKFVLYVDNQEGWFPSSMGAIGLMVHGDPTVELKPLRVNRWGRVQGDGEGQDARALVSEMMRLREAILKGQPGSLSTVAHVRPPEDGVLRRSAEFKLRLWGTTGNNSRDVEGSWEGVAERLEPTRQALELILLRLQGELDPEDLDRLEGRIPFDSLTMQVDKVFEGDETLNVQINKYGVVKAGSESGTLAEAEIDHLGMLFERINIFELPDYFDQPAGFRSLNIPGARGTTFRLSVRKDGQTKDIGGFVEAGGPAIAVIQQGLELIAARVERRPARIGGVVEGQAPEISLRHHYITFTVDARAGNAQSAAWTQKIAEWQGKWVEIKALARLTTRETGQISPITVIYPQQAIIQGVVSQGGQVLNYMEVGQAQNEVQLAIALKGRAPALVGDQSGRWVTLKGFIFYDENFYPAEVWAEAIQVVISDRPKFRLFMPIRGERNDFLIQLHQDATRASPTVGAIQVTSGLQSAWVTNRQNGWSLIPEPPNGGRGGWAEENSREFHVGEDPKDVDDDLRRGTMTILREIAAETVGSALGGGGAGGGGQ